MAYRVKLAKRPGKMPPVCFTVTPQNGVSGKECGELIRKLCQRIVIYKQVVHSGWRFFSAKTDKATYEKVFRARIHLMNDEFGNWIEDKKAEVPAGMEDKIARIDLTVFHGHL